VRLAVLAILAASLIHRTWVRWYPEYMWTLILGGVSVPWWAATALHPWWWQGAVVVAVCLTLTSAVTLVMTWRRLDWENELTRRFEGA